MPKILVTGGSGLVGRHLRDILPDATYISSSDCDLRSGSDVQRLCAEGWDHIVHLAARVGGILENMRHPAEFIEDNLLMNTLLLKHARLTDVPRLTAILSTCIYPDVHSNYPMSEEDLHSGPPQSTNFPYAIAKRALAVQIDAYRKEYGLEYNYLTPCNLYGKYDKINFQKSHFLTALIGKIVAAERAGDDTVHLLGTGRPLRQFMYAGDLARTIKACIESDITESFNVATDENLSIREIAERVVATCSPRLSIEFDDVSPDGQFRKDVTNRKMMSVLPDFTFTPLEEGVRTVYQHYVENGIA